MPSFLRLMVVVCLVAFAVPSRGAEISCQLYTYEGNQTKKFCDSAIIKGEIVEGDYQRFVAFYRENHPFLASVFLHSPGGDVYQAIEIGRLLRSYSIKANAPAHSDDGNNEFLGLNICKGPECICASACALIWFGAPERMGAVGLHRPRNLNPSFGDLTSIEAEHTYKKDLRLIVQYLEEMEVSQAFIDALKSTSSSAIQWQSVYYDRSPSFAEWIDTVCGKLQTDNDKAEWLELFVKQNRSKSEERVFALLQEKLDNQSNCEKETLRKSRLRIPLPQADLTELQITKNQFRLAAPSTEGAEPQAAVQKMRNLKAEDYFPPVDKPKP
jgi:hypothetical protein